LARRIMKYQSIDSAARAKYALRCVLARPPAADEVQRSVALFDSERKHYEQDGEAAVKMATSELGPPEESHNMAEMAAWTVVSNVLLNLDETLNK
jgi:hypothetical protein